MKVYDVWVEGYAATGEHGRAWKMGSAPAESFADACKAVFMRSIKNEYGDFVDRDIGLFDPEELSYWRCYMYPTEAEARRSYG